MQYRAQSLPASWASPSFSSPAETVSRGSQVQAITRYERIFTISALLFLTEPLIMLFRQEDPRYAMNFESGDLFTQIILLIMYAGTIYLIRRANLSFSLLLKDKLIVSLLVLACLSAIWSEVPDIVLRRTVALVGTTIFGMYFGTRFSLKEQLRLLAWALGIAAVASLLFVVFFPNYGISHDLDVHAGSWRGIYVQKNVLARVMVLGATVFMVLGFSEKRAARWAGCLLCLGMMAMSTSVTAPIVLGGLAGLVGLYWVIGRPYFLSRPGAVRPFIIFVLLVAIVVGLAIAVNMQDILKALDRDPTLTGRTDLWSAVSDMISDQPLLGYGYGAFWRDEQGPSLYIWQRVKWPAPNAHNGFLDLILDVGFAGLFLFAMSYLVTLRNAINRIASKRNWESFWPLLFIVFMLLYNLTETSLVRRNNIMWVLYVAAAYSLSLNKQAETGDIAVYQRARTVPLQQVENFRSGSGYLGTLQRPGSPSVDSL